MSLSIKNIFLLSLILLFFPAFCIWISVKPIVIYFIIVASTFAIVSIIKPSFLLSKLKILFKISAFKYYLLFAIWCIISGLILVIFGKYKISVFIYYIFALLLIDYGMTYILPFLVYDSRKFNLRFFAKLFLTIYFIIFVIGILEYFGKTFNVTVLTLPSDFLGNQRLLSQATYIDGYFDRVRSIFAEPGWLGGFIFFNMPILYSLVLSKFKIFRTKIINLIMKKSLIPLMWLTIIFEQSAIWLVFNSILTAFYFRKSITQFAIKHFKTLLVIFSGLILVGLWLIPNMLAMDLGYYKRIINFLMNIYSFEEIVVADQSLGARLVSYAITIKIGIKNWLLGVGLGNTGYIFPKYYTLSTLPFVAELESCFVKYTTESAKMNYNGAIPYEYFAETGVIGVSLFYLFIFKTVKFLNKVKRYFSNLEFDFINGLAFSILATSVILFYDICKAYYYIWFLFGLSNIFLFKAIYEKRKTL